MISLTIVRKLVKRCPFDGYFDSAVSLVDSLHKDFGGTVRRIKFFRTRLTRKMYRNLLDQVFLELFLGRKFELHNRLERALGLRLTNFRKIFG